MLALTTICVSILKPSRTNLSPKLWIENPHENWILSLYSELDKEFKESFKITMIP